MAKYHFKILFIIYDDKAADAGCAVAAECRSVVEVANKGKEITQLTTQIEGFLCLLEI